MKNILLSSLISLFFIAACSNQNITENLFENINNETKILSDNDLSTSLRSFMSKLFLDLDNNKDNKLSKEETKNSILEDKFKLLDKNNDSFLSLDESLFFANGEEIQKRTQEKFKMVDINNDLLIDALELSKFYKKSPDESDTNKIKVIFAVFQSFDQNRDSKLNIDEFRRFMYILPISGISSSNPIIKKFPDIL